MEVIICIPGPWEKELNKLDIIDESKFRFDGKYIYLLNNDKRIEVFQHFFDEGLYFAFSIAGQNIMNPDDIEKIKEHKSALYIVHKVDSLDDLKDLVLAGAQFINNGGFAVKIETIGIAHSGEQWLSICNTLKKVDLFRAFVSFDLDKNKIYSTGMNLLGFPDAEISINSDNEQEMYMFLRNFVFKTFMEEIDPEKQKNYTMPGNDKKFTIIKSDSESTASEYYNPKGKWILTLQN